ncbi:MAG: ribosome biogenesis GTPase Der [Patescibacteria group bacterium]
MAHTAVSRSDLPMIAIVGRANVGKSTLWNRITERNRAIVSDQPHTTRDRNISEATWRGCQFEIVDTGGMDAEDTTIGEGIIQQARLAIKNADLLFFLIDIKTGLLVEDRMLAKEIRTSKKPVILVANKVDNINRDIGALAESGSYSLGFGDPVSISASTGRGIGDLLDKAFDVLKIDARSEERGARKEEARGERREARSGDDGDSLLAPRSSLLAPISQEEDEDENRPLRLVIMGRTNVGKSSLVNAILGEERVIVADLAHTTREPQDTLLTYKGREILLVDTAGIRKRAKLKKGVEREALDMNEKSLSEADVAVLLLDATEEPTSKDKELAGLMKDARKGLVIVVNKWDLIQDKQSDSTIKFEKNLRYHFPFLNWAPMLFISAKQHQRAHDVLDSALKIEGERRRRIDYNAINRLLKNVIKQKKPLQVLGPKSPHIHDIAQMGINPPRFLVTVRGEKELIHPSWLKFLERRIRDKFGFEGTPIIVQATNVPMAKADRAWNVHGPGMHTVE